ncbi:YdcF family protein [Corynebacterium urogenitale]
MQLRQPESAQSVARTGPGSGPFSAALNRFKRWSGVGAVALLGAEAAWLCLALIAPPGPAFAVAYALHFLPLCVGFGLSLPALRTGDRRRWLHTGMVVAAADYFSLAFGAVVVLIGGSLVWRVLAGLGLAVWVIVLAAFILFLRRIAEAGRRSFTEPLGGSVDDSVDGPVGGPVGDPVDGPVGDPVGGALDDSVGGPVGDPVGGALDDSVDGASGGASIGVSQRGGVFGANHQGVNLLATPESAASRLDAVIVLGAGLIGKRPGPLLAARVDRAVVAAPAGREVRRMPLVMTGGQGPDELVTEAFAMAAYACERHERTLSEKNLELLREDRATNTRENLRFSVQRIREGLSEHVVAEETSLMRVGVVTSDFHVPRTEMTARTVAELLSQEHGGDRQSTGAPRMKRSVAGHGADLGTAGYDGNQGTAGHGADQGRAGHDGSEQLVQQGTGNQCVQSGGERVEFIVIGARTPRAARAAAYIREFVALALWKVRELF